MPLLHCQVQNTTEQNIPNVFRLYCLLQGIKQSCRWIDELENRNLDREKGAPGTTTSGLLVFLRKLKRGNRPSSLRTSFE